MAIRLDPEAVDAQGLPVVTWEEDRNLFAPEGAWPARVTCFIRRDEESGELQFVSVGTVRHGAIVEARSWQSLVSFEKGSAEQHYYSAADRALLDIVTSKSKSGAGRLLATDGAHVMLANFADKSPSVPMHLNCADCAPVEMALLHDVLHREFIGKRSNLLRDKCDGEYVWPKDKPFAVWQAPAPAVISRWKTWLVDISIAIMLASIGWGLYEFLLR